MKEYPNWCCQDCGRKYGKWSAGCSTFHLGICEVCGKEENVTEPRDYGYPNFPSTNKRKPNFLSDNI